MQTDLKGIESINLILKNAKINLLLTNNNLTYINNLKDSKCYEKILNVISKINST